MNNKIEITEVQDWLSNVLTTFQGEKTMEADEWIEKAIYEDMIKNGIISRDMVNNIFDNEELEELFNSYRDDYYIITKNLDGEEVVWEW